MILALTALLASLAMPADDFAPPGPAERLRAIGDVEGLPPPLRRALDPREDFEPIPEPGPSDWLASHPETPQTFDAFQKSRRNVPGGARKKLYFQPLGDFPAEKSPPLEVLKEFAAAFFALDVELLTAVPVEAGGFTTRDHPDREHQQILTGDVLAFLKKRLPEDAFCVLAITMKDLYPDPAWNFVFGQASLRGRTGVYSFARYDPAFYGQPRAKEQEKLVLRRSLKVLVHETAHMFGITHCVHFKCLMNGSNHLEEADSRPLRLCPVCLRKLHAATGLDVAKQYAKLKGLFEKTGLDDEARWIEKRLRWVERG